jgi:hypothetical protein
MTTVTRTAAALAALAVLVALPAPQANADPQDTCRMGADGGYYTSTGNRCRSTDIQSWHIGGSPLFCWYYPADPLCR